MKVNRIVLAPRDQQDNNLRTGKIYGKTYPNILMDSGAQVSLVKESCLPENWKRKGSALFQALNNPLCRRPSTDVELTLEGRDFVVECVVVEDVMISSPMIVGSNVPRASSFELLAESTPLERWPDLEKIRDRKRSWEAQLKAETQEETAGDEQTTEDTTDEQEVHTVNRLQLVHVTTRAQAKRKEQSEREDEEATEQSEARITQWDSVEVLPEGEADKETGDGEGTPYTPKPDTPRDRRQMARAQKADPTLKDLFEAAGREDSQYELKRGLLMKKSTDQQGEGTRLLVVPTGLRRQVWEDAHSSPLAGYFGSIRL